MCVGWSGWGCTDDSTAQSYGRQLTATLLLTLSNLSFLPAIIVAIIRCYITEASVYLFTMFFSTVTHTHSEAHILVHTCGNTYLMSVSGNQNKDLFCVYIV